jgi:prepilin-type N-terminal cleavage/methylation domain-containing protein
MSNFSNKLEKRKETSRIIGQAGFTLVELTLSIALFSTVIVVITSIFLQSVKFGRLVSSQAAAIDNVGLAVEQMAREIRTGVDFDQGGAAVGGDDPLERLKFINYRGEKSVYCLKNNVIRKGINPSNEESCEGEDYNDITSANVKITRLAFRLMGDDPQADKMPPRITILVGAEGPLQSRFDLETTVGARLIYYQTP